MNTRIYNHDTEWDLFQKNNYAELQTWINLLESLLSELETIVRLAGKKIFTEKSLIQKVTDKKTETNSQLNLYYKYLNQVKEIRECEDMDCERYYQREHEQLRALFNYHFEQCSKLKCNLLKSIESNSVPDAKQLNSQERLK